MAISGGDGSIILSTKVDTSGINKGMNSIKGTIGKIGAAIGVAFGVSALVNFGKAAVNLASDLQEVQNVVDVAFANMNQDMEDFAKTSIETFGISELTAKQTGSSYMAMARGMQIAESVASDMALTLTGLSADMASFYNINQSEARTALSAIFTGETETLKRYGILITEVNLQEFARRKGIAKSINAMTQQEKVMLRYQYVLEATQLAQGDFLRTQNSWANQTRILSERWKEMQRIFGEAFMMLGTLVLPAINELVYGLTKVAEFAKVAASNIYEMFTGKKFDVQEEKTSQIASNIGEQAENQKEFNKELNKSLANFDDIQILTSQTTENTEMSSSGLSLPEIGGSTGLGANAEADTSKYQEIASTIKSTLSDILYAASKALLAVGLIVLFSGNVLGGIGLILAGATAYVASDVLGSENPLETLKQHLATIEEYIVPALLGLGVLLLLLGQIPLGIGLIIAGAGYWGYSEVQSEEYDTATFQQKLDVIMEAVSLAIFAIGVLLIMFGHIPLGIGMVIFGANIFNLTEAKLNESETSTKIQTFFQEMQDLITGIAIALIVIGVLLIMMGIINPLSIGMLVAGGLVLATNAKINKTSVGKTIEKFFKDNAKLIVGVSLAMLVLGIILCFVPGALPLAIGLIVFGAEGLVTEAVLNWDFIKDKVSNFISNNSGLFAGVGIALVILGIVLICTGVGIPLGIGLIIAGGASLAAAIAPNWNFITEKVKEMWENIKRFWNANIAPIFTAQWWLQLGKNCINGLIGGFEGGINGIIRAFEDMINWIVDGLNTISFDIPDFLGGGNFGINIPRANFGRINIPRLAQGAVIPANREFLAVLGDQKQGVNIEAPLQTIVDAFNIALSNNGGYNSGKTEVVLEIDGREFGRAVVEQGNRENRRIGTRLVIA